MNITHTAAAGQQQTIVLIDFTSPKAAELVKKVKLQSQAVGGKEEEEEETVYANICTVENENAHFGLDTQVPTQTQYYGRDSDDSSQWSKKVSAF